MAQSLGYKCDHCGKFTELSKEAIQDDRLPNGWIELKAQGKKFYVFAFCLVECLIKFHSKEEGEQTMVDERDTMINRLKNDAFRDREKIARLEAEIEGLKGKGKESDNRVHEAFSKGISALADDMKPHLGDIRFPDNLGPLDLLSVHKGKLMYDGNAVTRVSVEEINESQSFAVDNWTSATWMFKNIESWFYNKNTNVSVVTDNGEMTQLVRKSAKDIQEEVKPEEGESI